MATRSTKKNEVNQTAKAEPAKTEVTTTDEQKQNALLEELKKQNEMLQKQFEMSQEQNNMLQEQMNQLKTQVNTVPQTIFVSQDRERVDFLWLAPVADENELLIGERGEYGKITGKVGNFSVPKNDLSRILDSMTRDFIKDRWLIVLGGFTDEEREMYGVNYKPGEVLDKQVFTRMLECSDDIVNIYTDLCDASKKVVAKVYYESWMNPETKRKVSRDVVVKMNKIAPQPGFKAILEGMNKQDLIE